MRTLVIAIAATAVLGLAPSALAQQSVNGPNQMPNIPQGSGGSFGMNVHDDASQGYDLAVMMLKKKVERVTREDGGKLTSDHLASLQAELDGLNHRFGARPAQRASFGRHEAAPGPSSSSSATSG